MKVERGQPPILVEPSSIRSSEQSKNEVWLAFLKSVVEGGRSDAIERKQNRSKKRDQEILRAALRVFARDGIFRARIGDIASEAGMSVSSIYDYYPSKEDLAYAVPQLHLARFFKEYMEAVADKKTTLERLRLYLWLAADFARRNPEWARTLYLEIWPSVLVNENSVRHRINDYVRIMLHLIRQGEMNGEWPPVADPYEIAAILNGSVNQIIITWLLYRRPRDLMRAITSVIELTLSLLRPVTKAARPRRDQNA
jgi:AcrR family transcriptional regulator